MNKISKEEKSYRAGMYCGFTFLFAVFTIFTSLFLCAYIFNRYDSKVDDLVDLAEEVRDGGAGGGSFSLPPGPAPPATEPPQTQPPQTQPPQTQPPQTQPPQTQPPQTQPPPTQPPINNGQNVTRSLEMNTTGYLVTPKQSGQSLMPSSGFSFVMWVKLPNNFQENQFIATAVDGDSVPGWTFALTANKAMRFAYYRTTGSVAIMEAPANTMVLGNWVQTGFAYSPSGCYIFVNDQRYLVSNLPPQIRESFCALQINGYNAHAGVRSLSNRAYLVAQVATFNKVLDDNELAFIYNGGAPRTDTHTVFGSICTGLFNMDVGANLPIIKNSNPNGVDFEAFGQPPFVDDTP